MGSSNKVAKDVAHSNSKKQHCPLSATNCLCSCPSTVAIHSNPKFCPSDTKYAKVVWLFVLTSVDNVEYTGNMRARATLVTAAMRPKGQHHSGSETERSTLPHKVSTRSLSSAGRSTGLSLAPLQQLSPSQVQKRQLSPLAGASASVTGHLCVWVWRA